MQSRTYLLSAFTLSTAVVFGAAAMAADLPKEGSSTGSISFYGTFAATKIGKDRVLASFDGNGISVTNSFENEMTWHCWGTTDLQNGTGGDSGYCVGTDSSGDQIIDIFADEPHGPDAKRFSGTDKWAGGSGKYAGITGGGKTTCANARAPRPGTFFTYCPSVEWNYKIP